MLLKLHLTRVFEMKGRQCKGGKESKQRVIVSFLVNAAGGKEPSIVIWKPENPRCFKELIKPSFQ